MALSTIALVLLVSAIGASTASSQNGGVQWKPRPRMEYEYELSGRSLAGLPALQGQYSGVQYGGRVRVQGLTADTAVIRLEKMSWTGLHARMQSGWWSAEPQGNATLSGHGHMGSMPMPLSGAAAVARFQDGQVQTVLVSREARDWEVNLLQGVLGHMQIQAAASGNGLHAKQQQQQSQQSEQGVYRVLESGVSGRCMVLYEVSPTQAPAEMSAAEAKLCAGKPYVQITKTKNFTDCEQYAEQSRGLPRCSPAGNACASLWARDTLTQLVGCGSGADLQLVQAISSSSMQAELQTREESRAVVHSSVNMTLVRAQPVRERLATPKDGVVLNGLGYRVAGKQVNGDYGLDSDYSSEEDADDSVEVIRHPQQHQDDDSSDSSNTSESASADQKHKKNAHKNQQQDSSEESNAKHSSRKHKNQKDSSDASDSSASSSSEENNAKNNSRKHKNQQDSSASSSEENNAKHNSRKHKNQKDSSDASDSSASSSENAKHNSRKHKNQKDSSDASDSSASSSENAKHNNRKHKNQQDSSASSSEENNAKHNYNSRKHKNQQDSNSSEEDNAKNMKAKHSRKPRSAKPNHKQGASDDANVEDAFAGVLSPAAVQQNATLRAQLLKLVVEEVHKAGAELRRPDGPAPRTMERVAMAVRMTRALSADQLRSARDQLHQQEDKELFRDILAMCGSTPCVQETVAMIKDRKMSAVAAQMALASLADRVASPSRAILKSVQDLYQSSSDQQVKIAAALAMGNLAGRAPRAVAASAADFLAEQLSAANQADSKSSKGALRAPLAAALGRTATPQALQALIKIAKNAKNTPYQRAQAVLALRSSAQRAPAVARDALLALFHDTTEPAAVRMAAVSQLVYLRPSLPLWQRLAISTFYEPNMAVSSYVWATVHSFSQLQDPAYRQQTQFARLVLPLTRAVPQGAHLAFNVIASSVDAQLDRIMHEHISMMAPADAANAYYRRVVRRAGVSSLDQEVDLWGANPDELLQAAMDAAFGSQDKTAARPVVDNKAVPAFHSTRSIHDKLSIVRRRLQDPQGHLRLTLKPFVSNLFVPFNKDTPSQITKAARDMMDKLRTETHFHAQQMGGEEVSVATVTEMGFPVNLRIQAPWLVRAEGSAQLHRNHSANANITCLYTSGLSAQLSVQPSWTTREYLAAVNGQALVQLPATSISAQMNVTDGRVWVRAEPGHNAGATVLARVATQPLTSALDLSRGELATESAAAHNASRDNNLATAVPAQTVELSPWEDVSLSLRAPVDKAALVAWLRDSRTVLGFPVLGRPLTASRIELLAARPRAFNVSFALVKGMMQSGDLQMMYPASLRQEDAPEMPTTTEMPSTTTDMPSTTTEYPSSTFAYPTTPSPSAIRYPRASNGVRGSRSSQNGSMYVDDGNVDFTRSIFNATTLNPYTNRVNGSNELYVLSQVLAGMSAGRGYVLGVNVTAEATADKAANRYSAFWTFGSNLGGRLMRAGVFARSDANNAQMAATGAVLRDIPGRADLRTALRQLPAFMVKAEYMQIDASAVKKVVTAVMETDRSFAKTRRVEQAAHEQHCLPRDATNALNATAAVSRVCREILGAANTPDQFNATLNYNNAAEESWSGAVHGALQATRAYFWNQGNIMMDTLATGNNNELGSGVTVQADGTLNGWLQTPRTMTKVSGAKAPVTAAIIKAANKELGDFCGVSASRLVTLDGAVGDVKLGDCWHLLAKDCSGKSRVAVLAKAHHADHIEVEINIDNYQIARLYPDGSATLNGVAVANATDNVGAAIAVRDADDVAVMNIVRGQDGAMSVTLADHGMSLVYGNSSVVLQAGASLRGRLCGMCGNFDGSAIGDMLNPMNKAEKTFQAFTDSYAIKDAQCSKSRRSYVTRQ